MRHSSLVGLFASYHKGRLMPVRVRSSKLCFLAAASCLIVVVHLPQVKTPPWRNIEADKSSTVVKDDNDARRARIKSVCERHRSYLPLQRPTPGIGVNLPSPSRRTVQCDSSQCPLFVDDSRSLAFCFIAKVASTSLKGIFAPLLNVTVDGNGTDALHWSFRYQTLRFGPRTLLQGNRSHYTKALFVRHPFERLVSTYIDKALRGPEEMAWAYKLHWYKIPGVYAKRRSPTFSEFVEYVLATTAENADEHWYPYYALCQPCLLDYDFVGKLETAGRDFPLFFSLVDIGGKADVLAHDNTRHEVRGISATDTEYYFKQLSFHQVMRLYAWYFYDFELFGYDFREYLP
ncbi:carbohydrate sulfotransferase 12-like isoform X1 [Dermacentor albipictus]|uniref:carbohydrate sulfotransferase 12-like isoform X1 n=1 Tax=Dermacentor albipictus TaxID=60249 RepID=UPI0031FD576B